MWLQKQKKHCTAYKNLTCWEHHRQVAKLPLWQQFVLVRDLIRNFLFRVHLPGSIEENAPKNKWTVFSLSKMEMQRNTCQKLHVRYVIYNTQSEYLIWVLINLLINKCIFLIKNCYTCHLEKMATNLSFKIIHCQDVWLLSV